MIVVSNTSPIVNLATIGQLDLLRNFTVKCSSPRLFTMKSLPRAMDNRAPLLRYMEGSERLWLSAHGAISPIHLEVHLRTSRHRATDEHRAEMICILLPQALAKAAERACSAGFMP